MVTTRAKAVKPPIASNKPLKLFLLKMSVISIKFTKRNFIQNDDLDIEPKKTFIGHQYYAWLSCTGTGNTQ